jgi:hypothetical protein
MSSISSALFLGFMVYTFGLVIIMHAGIRNLSKGRREAVTISTTERQMDNLVDTVVNNGEGIQSLVTANTRELHVENMVNNREGKKSEEHVVTVNRTRAHYGITAENTSTNTELHKNHNVSHNDPNYDVIQEVKQWLSVDKKFQQLLISTFLEDKQNKALMTEMFMTDPTVQKHLHEALQDTKVQTKLQNTLAYHQQADAFYTALKSKPMDHVFRYKPIKSPTNPCPSDTFAIILIFVHPDNLKRRQTLRKIMNPDSYINSTHGKSWHVLKRCKTLFLLAQGSARHGIQEEIDTYNDIILYPFVDSYHNLTMKTLASLQFINAHCMHASYWIKLDSDTFLNLPKLVSFLESGNFRRTIIGRLTIGSEVFRTGKWRVRRDLFPLKYYPTYVQGQSYIITTDLAPDLFAQAQRMEWVNMEDAFITGIVAKVVQANHLAIPGDVHNKGYNNRPICKVFKNSTICTYRLSDQRRRCCNCITI